MVELKKLLLRQYNRLIFLFFSYYTYFIFLKINASKNGTAVTKIIFISPKINFNIPIFSLIDTNIKNAIPVNDSGIKTSPISKQIGDNDFNSGYLVSLSVSANGCFFPHFGQTLSSSFSFFPHDIHCILSLLS